MKRFCFIRIGTSAISRPLRGIRRKGEFQLGATVPDANSYGSPRLPTEIELIHQIMSICHFSSILQDPYFTSKDKTKFLIAIVIALCADHETGYAWPSLEHIAQQSRSTVRNVVDLCAEMQKDGKLVIEPGVGPQGKTLYRLIDSAQPDLLESAIPEGDTDADDSFEQSKEVPPLDSVEVLAGCDEPSEAGSQHPLAVTEARSEERRELSEEFKTGLTAPVSLREQSFPPTPCADAPAPSPALLRVDMYGEPALGLLKPALPNPPRGDEASRIAALFGRPKTDLWSEREVRAFDELHPIEPEDLTLLEAYYASERRNPQNYLRRSIKTFLCNFTGELDRARGWRRRTTLGRCSFTTQKAISLPARNAAGYGGQNPFKSIR